MNKTQVSKSILLDTKRICRLCLCPLHDELISIFEVRDEIVLHQQITRIADIDVKINDGLPEYICCTCLTDLKTAIAFKNKCEIADRILRTDQLSPKTSNNFGMHNETVEQKHEDSPNHSPLYYKYDEINLETEQHDEKENDSFKCEICRRIFKTDSAFKKHISSLKSTCVDISNGFPVKIEGYGKERIFMCIFCEYSTNSMMYLRQHVVRHTGEKPWKCDICPKAYTQKGVLKRHKIIAHSDNLEPVSCPVCCKTMNNSKYLERHMAVHTDKRYTCEICSCNLKSKKSLLVHMLTHNKTKNFTCEICAATFYTSSGLCNHKKKHNSKPGERLFSCTKCEYKATRKSVLLRHLVKHNILNKFPCKICGMFFDSVQRLNIHEKRHLDNTNRCPLCQKHIIQKKNLDKHLKRKHKVMSNRFLRDLQKN